MANILSDEKQGIVIGALAEGNSIRSIERMTGIHRDTIMRLGLNYKALHRFHRMLGMSIEDSISSARRGSVDK